MYPNKIVLPRRKLYNAHELDADASRQPGVVERSAGSGPIKTRVRKQTNYELLSSMAFLGCLVHTIEAVSDTLASPIFHIVEEPGAIEHMVDCLVPTEEYYAELGKDMAARHPNSINTQVLVLYIYIYIYIYLFFFCFIVFNYYHMYKINK